MTQTVTAGPRAVDPKPRALLRSHVHHSRLISRQGLMERLFTLWFSGFVYNQIWEDPRVDLEALELDSSSRVLTIASGGCNVLNYLTRRPASITAVDLNRHHIYLTRLKLTALQHLPDHEAFFQFFGCGDVRENIANYERYVRPHLDAAALAYWDGKPRVRVPFRGSRIHYFRRSFYNYSKLGMLLRFTHLMGRLTRRDPRAILDARTLDEQRAFFEQRLAPFFANPLIRLTGRLPLVCFSLGIPPAQAAHLKRGGANIVDEYGRRVRRLACDFPIDDNYFAWQAFSRRYDRDQRKAVPDYLRAEHFETIRDAATSVSTHVVSLTDYLRTQPEQSLNRFVFLDAQDWLKPAQLTELWEQVDRTSEPGTRIIFRTAGFVSPLESALPAELRARFIYHPERSAELHAQDRSAIYGGFHLYVKQG